MKKHLILIVSIVVFITISFSQIDSLKTNISPNTGSRYLSSGDGIIRMYVNVWGHVANPGRILVDEGIDIATLLSLTGGPNKGANMKQIRIYHEFPDQKGNIIHTIDFTNFLNQGDRSNFITVLPNDTFIIKQTSWSYIIQEISTINTIMNLINIYLNLSTLLSSTR